MVGGGRRDTLASPASLPCPTLAYPILNTRHTEANDTSSSTTERVADFVVFDPKTETPSLGRKSLTIAVLNNRTLKKCLVYGGKSRRLCWGLPVTKSLFI